MRGYVVVSMVFIYASIQSIEGKMDRAAMQNFMKGMKPSCMKTTGAAEEHIINIHKGVFTPDRNFMCYLSCLYQKLRAVKSGKISVDLMRAQARGLLEDGLAANLLANIEKCQHHADIEDLCEAAYYYTKCCYENDASMDFLP